MKRQKYLTTLLLIMITSTVRSQLLQCRFQGNWTETTWTYDFRIDGTYKWTTWGHYGRETTSGVYKINNDTIHLLTGLKGTLRDKYLIDKDSFLVDVDYGYDYKLIPNNENNSYFENGYSSKKRMIKYPQTSTENLEIKSDLKKVLNLMLNSSWIRKYYYIDELPMRKLSIASYLNLQENIQIDSLNVIFSPKDKINERVFLEFEEINQNPQRIDVKIRIHGKEVSIWVTYNKESSLWTANGVWIIEKNKIGEWIPLENLNEEK